MTTVIELQDAIAMIPAGASIMVGGFLSVGTPSRLVDELLRQQKKDLVLIGNDTAWPTRGVGKLVAGKLVRKVIVSHIGTNPETQRQMIENEVEVELVPQGTLAERIRADGFGLGGVLTPTGVGTMVAEGKKTVDVDGRTFLLEPPLHADFALIGAKRADYAGNLEYSLTARNFNPLMAMAATTVLAEAEDILPVGVIPPDSVITPGVLVDYLLARERRHG